jgi:neutral ceramidase
VADDGDWCTRFSWSRKGRDESVVTVNWVIPPRTPAGRYRLRYQGDACGADGSARSFTGTSRTFEVE